MLVETNAIVPMSCCNRCDRNDDSHVYSSLLRSLDVWIEQFQSQPYTRGNHCVVTTVRMAIFVVVWIRCARWESSLLLSTMAVSLSFFESFVEANYFFWAKMMGCSRHSVSVGKHGFYSRFVVVVVEMILVCV